MCECNIQMCGACVRTVEKWKGCVEYEKYKSESDEMVDSPKNTQWIDKHGCDSPPKITNTIKLTRCSECKVSKKPRSGAHTLVESINDSILELAGVFVVRNEANNVMMDPWVKLVHDPVANERGGVTETETENETEDEEDEEASGDDGTVMHPVVAIKK